MSTGTILRSGTHPALGLCPSLNVPCRNHILLFLRVDYPLAVIRPERARRCVRGADGVEQPEPHVNEHLHLARVVT